MSIIKFNMNLFGRKKIICKHYFDNNEKTIDLPSIKADASLFEGKGEGSLKFGKITNKSKAAMVIISLGPEKAAKLYLNKENRTIAVLNNNEKKN